MTLLRSIKVISIIFASAVGSAAVSESDPVRIQIMPDEIKWASPLPAAPGFQSAWLIGGVDQPGLYEVRVRLASGAVIPPHTHPDNRCFTVLSGKLSVGTGDSVEPEKTKTYPAGSFYCVPAGVAHYVVAKNGELVFQDSGVGPTATNWVKK